MALRTPNFRPHVSAMRQKPAPPTCLVELVNALGSTEEQGACEGSERLNLHLVSTGTVDGTSRKLVERKVEKLEPEQSFSLC